MQEKLKKQMVDKFRESQTEQLEKAVASGRVADAQQLMNDTNDKLKAKVVMAEAQRDCLKVRVRLFCVWVVLTQSPCWSVEA